MKNIRVREIKTSMSYGQMIEVKNRQCKVCQVRFEYTHVDKLYMADNNVCYDCQFWLEKWFIKDEPNVVRINKNHYIIGEESSTVKGMGGVKVLIKFFDGREVVTSNLWHQGEIPRVWQHTGLYDNAYLGKLIK